MDHICLFLFIFISYITPMILYAFYSINDNVYKFNWGEVSERSLILNSYKTSSILAYSNDKTDMSIFICLIFISLT